MEDFDWPQVGSDEASDEVSPQNLMGYLGMLAIVQRASCDGERVRSDVTVPVSSVIERLQHDPEGSAD